MSVSGFKVLGGGFTGLGLRSLGFLVLSKEWKTKWKLHSGSFLQGDKP